MEGLTDRLAHALRPVFRPLSIWLASDKRRWETWVYEYLVIAPILVLVACLTTDWTSLRAIIANWAGAVGVFYSFAHASVVARLTESQATREMPDVYCWPKANHYWLLKELAWVAAFLASGMYSALVGNLLFIIFPAWRQIHVETRREIREGRKG